MEPGESRPESSKSVDCDNVDGDSEVQYPLIDLKAALTNDLKERRQKEIDKLTNKGRRGSNFKNTEFSREVIGHNKMTQFQMTKAVNYYFSEFDYLREKIKRAQQKTMKQLQEIHCDKRRQLRDSYKYHNEEIRYDLQRMRDEEKFLAQQAELEEMMRRREKSIARISQERKVLMKEINPKEKVKKLRRRVRKVIPLAVESQPIEKDDPKIEKLIPSRSHSFLHAGAVEVTKEWNNPKTVKRFVDYYEVKETLPQIVPPEPSSDVAIAQNEPLLDVGNLNNSNSNQIEEELETSRNERLPSIEKKKTVKEIMHERKQQKTKELKEILNLPYTIYRRNSKGKLQKVDHPFVKHEFKEPSNKDKYKMRKVLGDEREKYQNYITELARTTEDIIQEDIKISRQLNAPPVVVTKEAVAAPVRSIGPVDWMRAYVSSNIPDDVDPSSTEAIIYCRYIRAPLHKYSHLPNYKIYHTPL